MSHSSDDLWVAEQLCAHVEATGATAFLDERNVQKGDDYQQLLRREVRQANELVALFTPWSINRPWVWTEIGAAWALDRRIIAILQGITLKELASTANGASILESRNVLSLNEVGRYFSELAQRVRGNNGA